MSDPVAVMNGFLEALNSLDGEGMLALVAEDITVELPTAPAAMPREVNGKKAFGEFFAGIGSVWSEFSLTSWKAYGAVGDAHRVFAEYASNAKNRDGSTYANNYLATAVVVDGKITRLREFFDPAPMVNSMSAAQSGRQP